MIPPLHILFLVLATAGFGMAGLAFWVGHRIWDLGRAEGERRAAARRQEIGVDTAADLLCSAIECCDQALDSEMSPMLPMSREHVQTARTSLGKALQIEIDTTT